jgi:hypothetical protein
MHRAAHFVLASLVAFALLVTGCSSSDSGPKGSPQTVKACEDTLDAIAKAGVRCGSTYEAMKAEFDKASGGCGNIQKVRDEASLRSTCFPSLLTISCTNLLAGAVDASCQGQLLKSLGAVPPGDSHLKSLSAAIDE